MPAGIWDNPSREREESVVSQRQSGPARRAGEQSYLQGVLSSWIPAYLTFTWGTFNHISFICLGSLRHKRWTLHCFQQIQTCWLLWGVMKDDVSGDDRPSANKKQSTTENISISSSNTRKSLAHLSGEVLSWVWDKVISLWVLSFLLLYSQNEANHENICCILSQTLFLALNIINGESFFQRLVFQIPWNSFSTFLQFQEKKEKP